MIDARSRTLDLSIHTRDYAIRQSPTVLSSARKGGTTGAVLWKIAPLFATWLSAASSPLRRNSVINPSARVVELGCGISGLLALCLGPLVGKYLATDQEYVRRVFWENIRENAPVAYGRQSKRRAAGRKSRHAGQLTETGSENIAFCPLDWEGDEPSSLRDYVDPGSEDKGFDLLLSCDCVYNEALVGPFVRTCADICRLRQRSSPTVCVIAQQLRSPEVLDAWLRETLNQFRVWRVFDEALGDDLKLGSGYVVYLLHLRGDRAVG